MCWPKHVFYGCQSSYFWPFYNGLQRPKMTELSAMSQEFEFLKSPFYMLFLFASNEIDCKTCNVIIFLKHPVVEDVHWWFLKFCVHRGWKIKNEKQSKKYFSSMINFSWIYYKKLLKGNKNWNFFCKEFQHYFFNVCPLFVS